MKAELEDIIKATTKLLFRLNKQIINKKDSKTTKK